VKTNPARYFNFFVFFLFFFCFFFVFFFVALPPEASNKTRRAPPPLGSAAPKISGKKYPAAFYTSSN